MIFLLLSILVPTAIYIYLPRLLSRITGKQVIPNTALQLACVCYFTSWLLPSPTISGQDTAFMTHLVGGGIFTGLLWLFVVQSIKWRPPYAWLEFITLFASVSALGAANELFELGLIQTRLTSLTLTDTSWDLLANTLGACLFYGVYWYYRPLLNPTQPPASKP